MEPSTTSRRRPGEDVLARLMFGLSIVYLALLAGLLHRHVYSDFHRVEFQIQVGGLGILWIVFIAEGLGRLIRRNPEVPFWKDGVFFLLVLLFPPLRIGARSSAADRALWLPRLGWQEVDRELRRRLERFFSIPMIGIALMVLPLLVIHFVWAEDVENRPGLALFLAIGNGLIWFAFALEFTIMVSVAKRKILYSTSHWVDLAIILLPLLQFLPFLPLLRLLRLGNILRLEQLTRMGRLYRLQGLALKLWRAVLLLEVVQRVTGQTLEKRLRKIQSLVAAKEEELEELREEIVDLQKRIAQQKPAEAVRPADDGRRYGNEENDHETERGRMSDAAAGDGRDDGAGTRSRPGAGEETPG
jgi:hypothetical protein